MQLALHRTHSSKEHLVGFTYYCRTLELLPIAADILVKLPEKQEDELGGLSPQNSSVVFAAPYRTRRRNLVLYGSSRRQYG
jgi:hypothetical protein